MDLRFHRHKNVPPYPAILELLSLTWINFNPSLNNDIHYEAWDIFIYPSPNFNGCGTVEVWEWKVISSHTLLGMRLLIHGGIKVSKRDPCCDCKTARMRNHTPCSLRIWHGPWMTLETKIVRHLRVSNYDSLMMTKFASRKDTLIFARREFGQLKL